MARIEARSEDPRVADALAFLATPAAIDALRRCAEGMYPSATRVAAARAAWELARDPAAIPALLDTLRRGASADVRSRAALALGPLADPTVSPALLEALLAEPDATARQVLYGLVLERHGLTAFTSAPSPLATLGIRLGSPARSVREDAASALRRLIADVAGGRSPREVGLHAPFEAPALAERVRASVVAPPSEEIDIDALIALRGRDRGWAEDFLRHGDAPWQQACREALESLRDR